MEPRSDMQQREALELDVLFVGGGPASLAGCIHLIDLARKAGRDLEVGLIEKGRSIGAHLLSGAVLDPIALKELAPDLTAGDAPVEGTDCVEELYYLGKRRIVQSPMIPKPLRNEGCIIVSASKLAGWLSDRAEAMGVNIFPGFAGVELLLKDGAVCGVRTGDRGRDKEGSPKPNYEAGYDIFAKVTVLGEGTKGSLLRSLEQQSGFSRTVPETYKTAVKEVVELPERRFLSGAGATVVHTLGFPLGGTAAGGGFIYRLDDNKIALGLVCSLGYEDARFEPHDAFCRYKNHPFVAALIEGGKVLQHGAKTLPVGGWHARPKLSFDGALVVGDSASMLNPLRLKGIHTAMKSGMLAAETIAEAFAQGDFSQGCLAAYEKKIRSSWLYKEVYRARNFSQAMARKAPAKLLHLGAQQATGGRGLVDPLPVKEDCAMLAPLNGQGRSKTFSAPSAAEDPAPAIDRLTGVYLSGTVHEENQPCHILLRDASICIEHCLERFGAPCTRFCPASVYEIVAAAGGSRRLQINPANCLHCKTCEIKDPYRNILWTCPEGGGGPSYTMM